MTRVLLNGVEIEYFSPLPEIPDNLESNGETISITFRGYPSYLEICPFKLEIFDDDNSPLFTGNVISESNKDTPFGVITTLTAIDRSRHLEHRPIRGTGGGRTFTGLLRSVVTQMLAAANATRAYPVILYHINPAALSREIQVYIQGQRLREALKMALQAAGSAAYVKVRTDTGDLEFIEIGYGPSAPISVIRRSEFGDCDKSKFFGITEQYSQVAASKFIGLGRHGDLVDGANGVYSGNDILIHPPSSAGQSEYGYLETADRIDQIRVDLPAPAPGGQCLLPSWSVSGIIENGSNSQEFIVDFSALTPLSTGSITATLEIPAESEFELRIVVQNFEPHPENFNVPFLELYVDGGSAGVITVAGASGDNSNTLGIGLYSKVSLAAYAGQTIELEIRSTPETAGDYSGGYYLLKYLRICTVVNDPADNNVNSVAPDTSGIVAEGHYDLPTSSESSVGTVNCIDAITSQPVNVLLAIVPEAVGNLYTHEDPGPDSSVPTPPDWGSYEVYIGEDLVASGDGNDYHYLEFTAFAGDEIEITVVTNAEEQHVIAVIDEALTVLGARIVVNCTVYSI